MRNIVLMLFPLIIIAQLATVGNLLHQRPAPQDTKEVIHVSIEETPPLFSEIHHIRDRKKSFFNFLRPLAESENNQIEKRRQRIIKIQQQLPHQAISASDQQWLAQLAASYKVSHTTTSNNNFGTQFLASLLSKVDQVPESLILAQAAVESAWGTSRFATQANNYFGQWCYTTHCGIVPRNRSEGKSHQVKKFNSVRDSIRGYMRNINSNAAYKELRTIRTQKRALSETLSGYDLAAGLKSYSALGNEYIKIVRAIITSNQLEATQHCLPIGTNCSIAEARPKKPIAATR